MEPDHYLILESSQASTMSEIKNAYHRLVKKWHPDKNPDNQDESSRRFKEISCAYNILSNAETKKKYDDKVKAAGDSQSTPNCKPNEESPSASQPSSEERQEILQNQEEMHEQEQEMLENEKEKLEERLENEREAMEEMHEKNRERMENEREALEERLENEREAMEEMHEENRERMENEKEELEERLENERERMEEMHEENRERMENEREALEERLENEREAMENKLENQRQQLQKRLENQREHQREQRHIRYEANRPNSTITCGNCISIGGGGIVINGTRIPTFPDGTQVRGNHNGNIFVSSVITRLNTTTINGNTTSIVQTVNGLETTSTYENGVLKTQTFRQW